MRFYALITIACLTSIGMAGTCSTLNAYELKRGENVGPAFAYVDQVDNPQGLTVRELPTPESRPLAYIPSGTKIRGSNELKAGWLKLTGSFGNGWVNLRYLKPLPVEGKVTKVDNPGSCLAIRAGPASSFAKVGCAQIGEVLNLTGIMTADNWLQLKDQHGWVDASSVQLPPEAPQADAFNNITRDAAGPIGSSANDKHVPQTASSAGPEIKITTGSGSFSFVDAKGDPLKSMIVYTYLPKRLRPDTAPIVFIMHGHLKNARGYRDDWIQQADKHGFMIVAPLFDLQQWPGHAYSYASVMTREGKIQNQALWSFSAIEHLFDAIKEATGNRSPRYYIYGHSEGGQFVQRFVLFLPEARYAKAVAANPGWYTMPTFHVKFPYGLGGAPATEMSLKKSLGREFVLMLGDRDKNPNDPDLRRTPKAMAQGVNRFERGHNYVEEARNRARELNCSLRWKVQVVSGVSHSNPKMAPLAAAVLMRR